MSRSARAGWDGAPNVPEEIRELLLGPGAPYELVTETVGDRRLTVFARRPTALRTMFLDTVAALPDRPFLISGERVWTFAEAQRVVDAVAALLAKGYDVQVGDRVAIVAANSAEYALTMWAVISAGGVVVSLNGWWTGPELADGIALTQPKLVLGDERRLARLATESLPPDLPVRRLDAVVDQARGMLGASPLLADIEESAPAVILFTSGTTGRSKGATLTQRNIINSALSTDVLGRLARGQSSGLAAATEPAPPSTVIVANPMFHVSGLIAVLMRGGANGTTLVFPPPGRWDVATYLELTARHRVSAWSGVPTQFWRIVHHPDLDDYDLRCVQSAGCGGAPMPPDLVRAFAERLPWIALTNGYGMSENSGLGTRLTGAELRATADSVGFPGPTVEVEIRDASGRLCDEGDIGEIHLRSPSLFAGYWADEEATRAVVDAQGWYRTGDFGRVEGGALFVESRRTDLIIRGGENIYPLEIENRLVEHPDVDDAAVIGTEHEELGQVPKALVVLRPGSAGLTAEDVRAWVAAVLAPFKVPAEVEFWDSLPYSETGKLLRRELT